MFEKLLELLKDAWSGIKPFFVVDVFETAGVLRLGKYHRTALPGLHWKIPFADVPFEITTVETTWRSPAQPLTTKDDIAVTVMTVVRYSIRDVRPYITMIYDQHDVLADRTMGLVRRHVAKSTYRELVDAEEPEREIATRLRRAVSKYGFEIEEVTFTAFTRSKPITLITQSVLASMDN
jgi:regulator of protease activity HflC (stomatin/prohibitin superfamily)